MSEDTAEIALSSDFYLFCSRRPLLSTKQGDFVLKWTKKSEFSTKSRKIMLIQDIKKKAVEHVEKFVENFGKKWKKMENFCYFCTR